MDDPDLADLARRYLDLWERQIAASPMNSAGDSTGAAAADAARVMAEAMAQTMTQTMSGIMPMTKGRSDDPNNDADGASTPKPASLNGDGLNDELARRLAECAERFAALAAGTNKGSG
ncbi:MAG: hypothetical protein OSB58_17370 [Alphaproteobacteria bacterium]|jgi:hypothetical protein|nr:hypothetical protein [Alphaproteobacteria bacterium]